MSHKIIKYSRNLRCAMLLLMISLVTQIASATQYRVLFLGNSYTAVNDLPTIIKNLAASAGDQLIFNSNVPGGYTFEQHSADQTSVGLIMQGNWDYVILQEQSQRPSFPDGQVALEVYPYARQLDSLVKAYNPCAKTVFYMTWGRKNGDQSNCAFFPPLCTYTGMDSLLQLRYTIMASDNEAVISPVAKVWRKLRNEQPGIELYNADESHPSMAGTYAAACTFYSIIFRKDPMVCTYTASLSTGNASLIKNTVKQNVFDSLNYWYRFNEAPVADFTYSLSGNTVNFSSNIDGATALHWSFGDGGSSTLASPSHIYTAAGTYAVALAMTLCGRTDTVKKNIVVGTTGIEGTGIHTDVNIFPNPANDMLYVQSNLALSDLSVYDLNGRKALQLPVAKSNINAIDVRGLVPGLYHLVIHSGTRVFHYRFSKQ